MSGILVTLVRHGHAAAGWDADLDPGLSELGRTQAAAVADELAPEGPLPIVTSPLRRARETAAPLAARWGVGVAVAPAVGEIVAPAEQAGLKGRTAWLRTAMAGRWSDLGPAHHRWRDEVLAALRGLEADTVVFSHFIAINVVVGAATGDERVVCFAPDNCSTTVVLVDGDDLHIVSRGREAVTQVG